MMIGLVGAAILCAEDAWAQFRKEKGLRDPFWDVKMENFRAKCRRDKIRGVECISIDTDKPDIIQLEPDEIERYNDLHDKFVASYLFFNNGFEVLCRTQYKNLKDWFLPCDGPDGQCHMGCNRFGEPDCRYKECIYPGEFADIFDFIKKDSEDK